MSVTSVPSKVLLGFGHSHIVALMRGFYALRDTPGSAYAGPPIDFHYLHLPEFMPNVTPDGLLAPALRELLARGDAQGVVLSLGGNEHNVFSILQPNRKFDFVLKEKPDLPLLAGSEIYPETWIREALRERMGDIFTLLGAFRAASPLPMAYLEPPPPLPLAHVLAYPGELIRDESDRARLSPESFRYKVWHVMIQLLQQACAASGVAYVASPSDAVDASGVLAEPYRGEDATHANGVFGQRMLYEVLRRFSVPS